MWIVAAKSIEIIWDYEKLMTKKQRKLARHALGLPNKNNMPYRNRFYIGKGGDGYDQWEEMVVQGYAVKQTGPRWGGDDLFYLTLKGALKARNTKEHLAFETNQEGTEVSNAS